MSDLVGNPEDWFSQNEAQMMDLIRVCKVIGISGHYFRFCEVTIIYIGIIMAMHDLVQDVDTMIHIY